MSATAIRRLKNTELANAPLIELTIEPKEGKTKDDIVTSETAEATDKYRIVDERAYTLISEAEIEGKQIFVTTDELLDICEEVDRNVSDRYKLGVMVVDRVLETRKVEFALKKAHEEIDQLREALEEMEWKKNGAVDGTEYFLDELMKARSAEAESNAAKAEAISKQKRTEEELAALKARIEGTPKTIASISQHLWGEFWTREVKSMTLDVKEDWKL